MSLSPSVGNLEVGHNTQLLCAFPPLLKHLCTCVSLCVCKDMCHGENVTEEIPRELGLSLYHRGSRY